MCDGDKALVVKDNNIIKVAKRNMEGIVPLYYDMKKAEPKLLDTNTIFDGLITAFTTGNIGPYSNNISKIWNSEHVNEQETTAIKWLCMENNYCIDNAKTLYMPIRPKEVDEIIKSYTKSKLPNFFIYAKDKTDEQVEPLNNSTMSQLVSKIPTSLISYCNTIGKFDYKKLMSGEKIVVDKEKIIYSYDYWSKRKNFMFNADFNGRRKEEELFVYQQIRNKIIEDTGYAPFQITDVLVEFIYTKRKTSIKQVLWACFGDVIVENLKKNLASAKPICPVCGKRFKPLADNQLCCSRECSAELNRQKQHYRNHK